MRRFISKWGMIAVLGLVLCGVLGLYAFHAFGQQNDCMPNESCEKCCDRLFDKCNERIEDLRRQLEDPNLTLEQREAIELKIVDMEEKCDDLLLRCLEKCDPPDQP